MLTFLPFEGYYSFFLKDFKSVLCTLILLKLSSVIGRRPFPKRHIRWIMVLWQSFLFWLSHQIFTVEMIPTISRNQLLKDYVDLWERKGKTGGVIFFLRLFRVNRSVGGANRHVKQHVTYMARTWRCVVMHVCAKKSVCVICPHEKSLCLTMCDKLIKTNVARW